MINALEVMQAMAVQLRTQQGLPPRPSATPQRRKHGHSGGHLAEMARQHGIRLGTLVARLQAGWELERALTTPVQMSKTRGGRQ